MDLSRYPSAAIPTKMPTWLISVLLLCVALLFAGELASVSAISGWCMTISFRFGRPSRHYPSWLCFANVYLPTLIPPLYFSLLHFLRQAIPDDGTVVVVVNISAIAAAAAAVYIPSRRAGVSGLAIAGIAAFALSGPVL